MKFSACVICIGGLMACAQPPTLSAEDLRGAECMANVLKTMMTAQDVRVGSTYGSKERRYLPTVFYGFKNSTGSHSVEIQVVGDERRGYAFIVTSIPDDDGSPVTRQVLSEWYDRCGAEGIAIEM